MNQAMHSIPYFTNPLRPAPSPSAYEALDDAALVQVCLSGCEKAWEQLLQRHGTTMRRCITSVTSRFRSVASSEDEQDIYSTVCLRLVQNGGKRLAAFDPERGCSLAGWLGTIAIRTTYDFLRKHKRDCKRSPESVLDFISSGEPDPFDIYLGAERTRKMQTWMHDMNPRDRKFLEHVCADSVDPKTLAENMGISVATVYSKKHKLIARLNRKASQELASVAA